MSGLFLLALAFGAGIAVGLVLATRNSSLANRPRSLATRTPQVREKEDNIARLRAWLSGREEATNDEVEDLLGVSDATATRYLQALEQEGLLVQEGQTGRSVRYRVVR